MDIKVMTKLENEKGSLIIVEKEDVFMDFTKEAEDYLINVARSLFEKPDTSEHIFKQAEWNLVSVDASSFILEPRKDFLYPEVLVLHYKNGYLQLLRNNSEKIHKKGEKLPEDIEKIFDKILEDINKKFNRVKLEMKITNFKVKRRNISLVNYENVHGKFVVEDTDIGNINVDIQLPEGLQNYIFNYFKESKSYGNSIAKEIASEKFVLIGYIGLRGWILESQGSHPFRIYFDYDKFIISSEKEPNVVDGNRADQSEDVKDALDSIDDVFSDYIDEILNLSCI